MSKRFLAILMAACIVFTTIPMRSMAEDLAESAFPEEEEALPGDAVLEEDESEALPEASAEILGTEEEEVSPEDLGMEEGEAFAENSEAEEEEISPEDFGVEEEEVPSEALGTEEEKVPSEDSEAAEEEVSAGDSRTAEEEVSAGDSGVGEGEISTGAPEAEEGIPVTETITVETTVDLGPGYWDNEELFAGYVQKQMYSGQDYGISTIANYGEQMLTGMDRKLYDELKKKILEIAAGRLKSTEFTYGADSLTTIMDDPGPWTAEELGVEVLAESTDGKWSLTDAAKKAMLAKAFPDRQKVMSYLLSDLPYELYWYDKVSGFSMEYSMSMSSGNGQVIDVTIAQISFSMKVAEAYRGANDATVKDDLASVTAAVNKAKQIVADNREKSDVDKLRAYKDAICKLVSYNDDAAKQEGIAYGDPWQLIHVFDGDSNTKVVCEGYSKAFQYLCDLTTFNSDKIACYIVTGTMAGGTGAGRHMWNVVTMEDGCHYLVDVTNCDEGTVGESDYLFLAGYATQGTSGSYVFQGRNQNSITYTYDSDVIGKYQGQGSQDPVVNISPRKYGEKIDLVKEGAKVSLDKKSVVYTAEPILPEVTVTLNGASLVKDQDYTVSCTDNVNVGTATVTVTGTGAYSGTLTDTFEITKAPLTVTAKDHQIVYGDEPADGGVTCEGFQGGDGEGQLKGTLTYAYRDGNDAPYARYGSVGKYSIVPSGLTADNYEITYEPGTLTVVQREVTLEWQNVTARYIGDGKTVTASVTNLVNGDEVEVTVVVNDGQGDKVGTNVAKATALTGEKAGNYKLPEDCQTSFEIKENSYVITLAEETGDSYTYGDEVTVKATVGTMQGNGVSQGLPEGGYMALFYGEQQLTEPTAAENGTFTMTYSTRDKKVPAGSDQVLTVKYLEGEGAQKEVKAEADFSVTIQKKTLSAALTAGTEKGYVEKEYDGTVSVLEGSLALSLSENEKLEGDDVSVAGGFTLAFADKNVGEGKTIVASGLALAGADADWYALESQTVSSVGHKITPKELTIAVESASKVYGAEDPEFTFTAEGLVSGEEGLQVSYKRSTVPEGAGEAPGSGENVGSYEIAASVTADPSGTFSLGNYSIEVKPGTLTITPRPVVLKWNADSFVYDGKVHTVAAEVSNAVAGDVVTVSEYQGNGGTDANQDGTSYTALALALSNANYTLTDGTEVSHAWRIDRRSIEDVVVKLEETKLTYNGNDQTKEIVSVALEGEDLSLTLVPGTDYQIAEDAAGKPSNVAANAGSYTLVIEGIGNFTGTASIPWTIEKADLTPEIPEGLTAVYGQKLSDVDLKIKGWAWKDPELSVGNVEAEPRTFTAVYTPEDPDNYNTITMELPVTVTKADLVTMELQGYALEKVYDGVALTAPSQDQMRIVGADYGDIGFTWTKDGSEPENLTDVGVYVLTAVVAETQNTTGTTAKWEVTVQPRSLTVTADSLTKVYGEEDPELTYSLTDGSLLPETELSDVLGGEPVREEGEKVGSYKIAQGTLAVGKNYQLTFVEGTLTIEARTIELIWQNVSDRYWNDGKEVTAQIKEGSLLEGDQVEVTVEGGKESAVGTHTAEAKLTGEDAGNYKLSEATVKYEIQLPGLKIAEAKTDRTAYVYGDDVVVTARLALPEDLPEGTPLGKMALYYGDAAVTDAVEGKDGTFTLIYHTSLKYVPVGEERILTVCYLGNDVTGMTEFKISLKLSPKALEWDESGLTAEKMWDGNTKATVTGRLLLSGALKGDDPGFTYESLVGEYDASEAGSHSVTVTVNGAALSSGFYSLPAKKTLTITGKIAKPDEVLPDSVVEEEDGTQMRLVVDSGFAVIPEGLKETAYNTPDKIVEELQQTVVKYEGYTAEQTLSYDVVLQVSFDNGETWENATEENFPAAGLTVLLPYPEGTGKDTHDFLVTHMFTVAMNGHRPGEVEIPAVVKMEGGIQVTLSSLSPIGISWTEAKAAPPEEPENPGGSEEPGETPTEPEKPGETPAEPEKPGETPTEPEKPGETPGESEEPGETPGESEEPGETPGESEKPSEAPEQKPDENPSAAPEQKPQDSQQGGNASDQVSETDQTQGSNATLVAAKTGDPAIDLVYLVTLMAGALGMTLFAVANLRYRRKKN